MDFYRIATKSVKKGETDVYPVFYTKKSKDLMVKGGHFEAVWDPRVGLWSKDEDTVSDLIDADIDKKLADCKQAFPDDNFVPMYMAVGASGSKKAWIDTVTKLMADNFQPLDSKLEFSNSDIKKNDYATRRLSYPLEKGDYSAWDELVSALYAPDEKEKIEWAIGSVVNGASKTIQKFYVFYGGPKTGKSTILNIIQQLFDGYYTMLDAASLGSSRSEFSLSQFESNPLIAIQHDTNLSKLDDNTKLNSIVSHEKMKVNAKFKDLYDMRFITTLFLATNDDVNITGVNSGLTRRLIDINPKNGWVPTSKYNKLMKQITFQLGAIAYHCKEVFESDPHKYDNYTSLKMMELSNELYNFVYFHYDDYVADDGVSAQVAWEQYKQYCDDARVHRPLSYTKFKKEFSGYFEELLSRATDADGKRRRQYFHGFKRKLFEKEINGEDEDDSTEQALPDWLRFVEQPSVLDRELSDCPAQYAIIKKDGSDKPGVAWDKCITTLSDLDTKELHYVLPRGKNMIMLDYDIKGDDGQKNFELCAKKAADMPETYSELSKSGQGIHSYYIYKGDVNKLSNTIGDNVEIKVFPDDKKSTIRRKLTKCNNSPIATLNSGLPLKEDRKKVLNKNVVITEKSIRNKIIKIINREYEGVPSTISGVTLIKKILDEAYDSGAEYDVSDLKQAVRKFAEQSHNHMAEAVAMVPKMKFKSEQISIVVDATYEVKKDEYVFYDIEIFPNLFILCYIPITKDEVLNLVDKYEDKKTRHEVNDLVDKLKSERAVRLIQPSPEDIAKLSKYKLIGFNCRRYDNHICVGRMNGYSNEQCYRQSQAIINNAKEYNPFLGTAWDFSYTDVYDFCRKKQSLKKWEIELGYTHMENAYPWDEPLEKSHWDEVASYCCNDVAATLLTFVANYGDFLAREILSALSGLNANSTTNQNTAGLIFQGDKHPGLVYTDFTTGKVYGPGEPFKLHVTEYEDYLKHKDDWKSMPNMNPPKNCFPGYFYVKFPDGTMHNMFRGVDLGFGGYVYASPGMYLDGAITFDVASEHPHSIKELNLFGKYTQNFVDLMEARIAIKHGDYEKAKTLFGGKLAPYLKDKRQAKALAGALKIAINSVYGLTSAKFKNVFRDERNVNNIVALRGAIFMKMVQDAVEEMGYHVIHIKTDSIKIEHPDKKIADFVINMGHQYGYDFEVEHTWDRLCLVNNAVFIGRHGKDDPEIPEAWDAVGTQFQIPYVFKTLFSHEAIVFDDLCESKSVTSSLYLDCNEGLPDVTKWEDLRDLRLKNPEKLTKANQKFLESYDSMSEAELNDKIREGHNYIFVGKVGRFCPMQEGCGAGALVRKGTGRHGEVTLNSATGGKWIEDGKEVNRWLEAEVVKQTGKEKFIDRQYYRNLVDDAKATIEQFGSFDALVA